MLSLAYLAQWCNEIGKFSRTGKVKSQRWRWIVRTNVLRTPSNSDTPYPNWRERLENYESFQKPLTNIKSSLIIEK
jgi:hypothetical protein